MSADEPAQSHPSTTTGPDATCSRRAPRDAPSATLASSEPQLRPPAHPELDAPHGVHVHDLLRHGRDRFLAAHELERWLIRNGFARRDGVPGVLIPTKLAAEVADALGVMLP